MFTERKIPAGLPTCLQRVTPPEEWRFLEHLELSDVGDSSIHFAGFSGYRPDQPRSRTHIRPNLIESNPISLQQEQADACQPVGASSFLLARDFVYSFFLPDFFAAAQRLRMASAIRFRAAADMIRRVGAFDAGVDLFVLPGGRPRRFTTAPPATPSNACIAASSLPRSSLSCCTISLTFIEVF